MSVPRRPLPGWAEIAVLPLVNIAQVFEVGRVDGEYFLAIEFIDGRDLRRLLRRCRETGTRLPIDLCVFIARDLAADGAHPRGRRWRDRCACAGVCAE